MKFDPSYQRSPVHRDNVERVTESIVNGRPLIERNLDPSLLKDTMPAGISIATQLFGIPRTSLTDNDLQLAENLLYYIAKRHTHTISQMLGRGTYRRYVNEGQTVYPNDPKVHMEEADFSIKHELPHYLVAWLLNTALGAYDNSTTPSYIRELKDTTTELDADGIRRDYLEEVYAQVLDFDEDQRHSLYNEIFKLKLSTNSFEDIVLKIVDVWLVIERDGIIKYEEIDKEKVKSDYRLAKERLLEVLTASKEERAQLRARLPLECFVYDLCYAYYYEQKRDPHASFKVYQKYFGRLFAKANSNPYIARSDKDKTFKDSRE